MTQENKPDATEEIREKLAELEHEQWVFWSKDIASKEYISPERMERWRNLWVPYLELAEEQKEQDRIWARKSLSLTSEKIKEEIEKGKYYSEEHECFAIPKEDWDKIFAKFGVEK